jgi:hypothetical protein
MNRFSSTTVLAALAIVSGCATDASAPTGIAIAPSLASMSVVASAGTAVYNNIPSPLPPNVPSLGFQATQTAEFGDNVALAGTARRARSATVLMSSWALHSDYPTMPVAGYLHPITLNIYNVNNTDPQPALGSLIATVTQTFLIPWRPAADPTCPGGTAWRAGDGACYNGFAFTIEFDLWSPALTLPDELIFGVAFNTNTWGYQPIGVPGPYESLNVGLAVAPPPPSVGSDVEPDALFWNTKTAANYADNGAGGTGTFRRDTGWTPYSPGFSISALTVATTADGCKNDGWRSLARTDGSTFKNQGDCVSYVQTGK